MTDTKAPTYLENPVLRAHLDWLFARQRFGQKPGLTRVRALLTALGDPQRRFDAVLVGGTNGKGSTAAALGSMIRAAGRSSAVFTSPHLSHFAERFMIDGRYPSDEVLVRGLEHLRPAAENAGATFFEITTALACWLFAEADTDIAVMEVGLGGRFDSTNALEPRLSIITNISLDHTEILGDTETAIASEKRASCGPNGAA
ncbi:MAG: Mur ligase family protein [Trueperaceae bacterium]|nr:Mur ligase family protein [Trueperaceae bacterium]